MTVGKCQLEIMRNPRRPFGLTWRDYLCPACGLDDVLRTTRNWEVMRGAPHPNTAVCVEHFRCGCGASFGILFRHDTVKRKWPPEEYLLVELPN